MSISDDEAANELCRMFFRKRARIWAGEEDWRNEARPFGLDGRTYYLGRFGFHVKEDGRNTYFRPNKHLHETLRQVIRQILDEQNARHDARVTSSLLRRAS